MKKTPKSDPKNLQNPSKIGLVATKTETRKKSAKMDPKMEAQTRSFFWSPGSFLCARRPWEPKWLQRPLTRAPRTSPSLDFHKFANDFARYFHDFRIMWATFIWLA